MYFIFCVQFGRCKILESLLVAPNWICRNVISLIHNKNTKEEIIKWLAMNMSHLLQSIQEIRRRNLSIRQHAMVIHYLQSEKYIINLNKFFIVTYIFNYP